MFKTSEGGISRMAVSWDMKNAHGEKGRVYGQKPHNPKLMEIENVSPDDEYYLIGLDKDDRTGVITIWSKHIEVSPGENIVELTSNDVIYHE